MTKKDIAIIGGTFDPIHKGHTEIARFLSENYIVDEVWMLPSYNPPFKDINKVVDFNHRINMTSHAVSDIKRVIVSSFEEEYYYKSLQNNRINNETNSDIKTYTYDVLEKLKLKISNTRIHIILGFDAIKLIDKWHSFKELLNNYWFYIFDRKDKEFTTKEQKLYYLNNIKNKYKVNFYYEFFDEPNIDISSTNLRELLKDKKRNQNEILKYIDVKVYNYIVKHNLY